MRKLLILAAAASSVALGGCSTMMGADASADAGGMSAGGRTSASAGMMADRTPTNRAAYVEMAASSDMFEIQSSQLAMSRAQTPAVRQFAEMMVRDHTQMSQQLMAAASASGMPAMSPAMMPMHADMLTRLQAMSGAGFEAEYGRQQMMAHEMAVAMHTNYAARGDTPALRTVAAAAAPRVSQHLAMIRQYMRR